VATRGQSANPMKNTTVPSIRAFLLTPSLPMNPPPGPWPLGRVNARLWRVRESSLKAAVRTVFGSWAVGMVLRPRQLPMNRVGTDSTPSLTLLCDRKDSSRDAVERVLTSSWAVCTARRPWRLSTNLASGARRSRRLTLRCHRRFGTRSGVNVALRFKGSRRKLFWEILSSRVRGNGARFNPSV